MSASINYKILKYLCCPICKSDLYLDNNSLVCLSCSKKYEIVDGIPVLLDLDLLPEHNEEQRSFFDKWDFGENNQIAPWQQSYVSRFSSNFGGTENKIIVDCGIGNGYMTLSQLRKGAVVLACDLALQSLLQIRSFILTSDVYNHLRDRLFLICCNVENLPIKSKIVDYYIANGVLEHVTDDKKAVLEINRICKNHAGVMITVPISISQVFPLYIPIHYFSDKRMGHLRRYSVSILINYFGASWQPLKIYYTGHVAKVFKVIMNTIISRIFDERTIEEQDQQKEHLAKWSTNFCLLIQR